MTIASWDGPIGTFPNANGTGLTQNNPEGGPSFFNHGTMLLDPRQPYTYIPGQNFGKQVSGWVTVMAETLDQVPYTATINNIAGAQTATAGTALTLRSASATGITAGVSIINALTNTTVSGLLAIESAATTVAFGSAKTIQPWDPTSLLARNVRISCNGADQTGVFTVAGYDVYGFPMSEAITGTAGTAATAVVVSGAKAFKYITSVTPSGTVNSTGVSVGTGDVIGLPLRADRFSELLMTYGNTAVTASTGFTAAVTTTATTTSGDVRGTYALQTASNGVLRLAIKQSPQVSNLASSTGILGVTQA